MEKGSTNSALEAVTSEQELLSIAAITPERLNIHIGEPGTPLGALRGKEKRAALAQLLRDDPSTLSSEMRLRAYLAIGQKPDPTLLTPLIIKRALDIESCTGMIRRLAVVHEQLDVTAILVVLEALVSGEPADSSVVALRLARAVGEWRERSNHLNLPSLMRYVELVRRLDATLKPNSLASRNLDMLASFAIIESAAWDDSALAWELLYLINAARRSMQCPEVLEGFVPVLRRVLADTRAMAIRGEDEKFEKAASRLLRCCWTAESARQLLNTLYFGDESLPSRTREVLNLLLLIEPDDPPVAPDPATRSSQLAQALLKSWEAARDSVQAKEAFEELHTVLQKFFGIRLTGVFGEVTRYDPRLHDWWGTKYSYPRHVRIVKPLIQMSNDGATRILFKALVDGSDTEGCG